MVQLTKANPCTDCGGRFPAVCMDYDHKRNKVEAVGVLSTGHRWRDAFEEIEKCDLVCANCHRLRTWERQNGYAC